MFNKPLSDFLEYWTDVAQISKHRFDGSYPETGGLTNLPAGADRVITCYVINPQNYVLTPSATFASGSLTQGSDYSIEQDASDRTVLRLTLKDSYLQTLDGDGTEISPTVSITEPNSGRTFGSYTVPVRVNSAPPAVILPVVLRTSTDSENDKSTYVICFNLPDMTGIHRDITTLKIGSPYERTYTVNADGTLSGGDGGDNLEIKTVYDSRWEKVIDAEFIGDKNNRFVGIVTDVPLSDNLTTFTLTLTDSYGLSTSVKASTQAPKLDSVTASPKGGTIETGGKVTFTGPVPEANIVLTSDNWAGVKNEEEEVSNNQVTGTGSVTLTFTTAGTYNITAYAAMSGAADSDKVTFTYKVVDSAVYVSDGGNDGNPGTENEPVATLEKAIKLLNEAQFTEGKIVVMGTVQTGEVKIDTSDGTTGSLKTLTVRGSDNGGTLKNDGGRVFTIGSGVSLTLGENITLTGTVTGDNGGAVYVDSGTFTMERGSKITGSSAKYQSTGGNGGAVYVARGGEFNMNDGSKITGSSATGSMSYGGAVFIYKGTFNMSGGVIGGTGNEKNTAVCGGGVYVYTYGTFNMSDKAQIQGNEATGTGMNDGGGGVYVNGGEFTMSGGTISGNNADSNGGGVCVPNGTFTVNGKPTITDNTVNNNDNNVYLSSGKTITIGDGFSGGKIGVTAKDMTTGIAVQITDINVSGADGIFTSDNTLYHVEESTTAGGGTAVFLSGLPSASSNGDVYYVVDTVIHSGDFSKAIDAVKSDGGTITVFDPVEIAGDNMQISPPRGVTINITASGKTTVFDVQESGSLTLGGGGGEVNVTGDPIASPPTADGKEISLINISSGGTVTIADNANIQNNKAGRGVTVTDGTLIMTGGSIKDNTGGYSYGSGVYVSGSTAEFKMSGGEISGNTLELNNYSTRQGAGVMVCDGATFTLSDSGKITDNSGYEGVGVTVSGSTFNMKGGEISNNEGKGTSGGVYLHSGATMNMDGGTITENKAAKTYQGGGAGGVFIGSSCNFTGSTDPTTASITENYVGSSNVDVYFQSGGNGTYSPGNVQVGNPQNP